MFVHMKTLPAKTADALDLAIEFATLGEYGLEYPDQGPSGSRVGDCLENARQRTQAPEGIGRLRSAPCSSQATDFASALRPPRIRLSFTE